MPPLANMFEKAMAKKDDVAERILKQVKGAPNIKPVEKTNKITYKLVFETTEEFRRIAREIGDSIAYWEQEVHLCDQAFGDIRHLAEKQIIDQKKRTKVFKLLREYSLRRREAKDNLGVLQPLGEFIGKHKGIWQELDGVYGKMRKEMQHVDSERVYNPRVLPDIFD
jgi:hypothetical protein